MTEHEREEVNKLLNLQKWLPIPGPQATAYDSEAFETLYGGAAGGGKSDLLLGLARNEHRRTVIFRRIFPDLEKSIIPRSKEFYGDNNYYNEQKHRWNIENRIIWFSHLEKDADVKSHQSAQYDLIGFDELTQFTKFQYEYMLSRARTSRKDQKVRVVATTNPGGEGNDWVMERWAPWLQRDHPNPAKSGEVRWFKRLDNGQEVETVSTDPDGVSRTFIQARLSDNPFIDQKAYSNILNMLPEPYRSQLKNGDWQAGMIEDAYQVIPRAWIRSAMERSRIWIKPKSGLSAVGADIARGGDDKTVTAKRYDNWIAPLDRTPGVLTPDGDAAANRVEAALTDQSGTVQKFVKVYLDIIGIGSSAYDSCKRKGLMVQGVNFAAASNSTDKSGRLKFINLRAEYYWRARELLDPANEDALILPDDPELANDLASARWFLAKTGIQIESKDEIKQRIGRSPDAGDAVVLSLGSGTATWEDLKGLGAVEDFKSRWA